MVLNFVHVQLHCVLWFLVSVDQGILKKKKKKKKKKIIIIKSTEESGAQIHCVYIVF